MMAPLVTRFLQHLTQQNSWAKPYLIPFAGQIITFDFNVVRTALVILEDGSLATAPSTSLPNATVYIPPSLAMRLATGDEHAKSLIKIDGDIHVATEVSKVLQQMRWDIEDDISHLVGDIAAFKLGEVSKSLFAQAKKQTTDMAEMLTEYWQEERNLLAKKTHIHQFNDAVDTLRQDVDRFEKRIDKVLKGLSTSEQTRTVTDDNPAANKSRSRKPTPPPESI